MHVTRARSCGQMRDVEQDRLKRVEERGCHLIAARRSRAPERDVLVKKLARVFSFVRDIERAAESRSPHVSERAQQQFSLLCMPRNFKVEIPGHDRRALLRDCHEVVPVCDNLLETRYVGGKSLLNLLWRGLLFM